MQAGFRKWGVKLQSVTPSYVVPKSKEAQAFTVLLAGGFYFFGKKRRWTLRLL